jgi:hypothetical protein
MKIFANVTPDDNGIKTQVVAPVAAAAEGSSSLSAPLFSAFAPAASDARDGGADDAGTKKKRKLGGGKRAAPVKGRVVDNPPLSVSSVLAPSTGGSTNSVASSQSFVKDPTKLNDIFAGFTLPSVPNS